MPCGWRCSKCQRASSGGTRAVITASQSNDGIEFTRVGAEQSPEDFGEMNAATYAGIAFMASSPTGRGLIRVQASSIQIEPLLPFRSLTV